MEMKLGGGSVEICLMGIVCLITIVFKKYNYFQNNSSHKQFVSAMGPKGEQGLPGSPGLLGTPGEPGKDGKSGLPGFPGVKVSKGWKCVN